MTEVLVVTPKPSSSHLPRPGPLAAQTPCSGVPPKHEGEKTLLAAVGQTGSSSASNPDRIHPMG